MKISNCIYEDLRSCGVYQFQNLITGKVYVGSTTKTFFKRWCQHLDLLKNGKHKNKLLQADYNEIGENMFEFSIVEKIDAREYEKIYQVEEIHLQRVISEGNTYNTNPFSNRPLMNAEIINQQTITRKSTTEIAGDYYNRVKIGKIKIEDVPKKYRKIVNHYSNRVIWNKGLTKENYDYSHLKVPKTKTDLYYQGRENFKNTVRGNSKPINVFDYKGDFIAQFRCITDIVEYSCSEFHLLPLVLRVPGGRTSRRHSDRIAVYKLANQNIGKVVSGEKKHHKGLIFREEDSDLPVIPLVPKDVHFQWNEFKYFWYNNELLLSEEILIEKRGKIGEVHQCEDNTERDSVEKNETEFFVEHRS